MASDGESDTEKADIRTESLCCASSSPSMSSNGGSKMLLKDILGYFDLAVEELRTLMRTDSLTRFTSTSQYHEFYNQSANKLIQQRSN